MTNVAEINARDAVTWRSWTDYLCGESTDGLVNDAGYLFLFFFERVGVCTKIKRECDAVSDKLADKGIDAL